MCKEVRKKPFYVPKVPLAPVIPVPQDDDDDWDQVEDWELLGMDPESSQEEIDTMWDNQM